MKKRWIALLLALTMAAMLLAGCTKKTETPVEPEQGQTQQEENQTKPETNPPEEKKPEVQPENPDDVTPSDANEPNAEETPEEEPELTEEQKRQRRIAKLVEESKIWAADEAYNNFFTETLFKTGLEDFLFQNWDNVALGISSFFDADDCKLNLYQNSLDEYFCVLSHASSFQALSIRLNADGASVFTPETKMNDANVSADIAGLVDGAKFDKRYDRYYFDDQMDETSNKTFRGYAALALNAFKKTLEENKKTWKPILDDAFQTTVSFDENDQFVLEIQCKSLYWLELRYRPECGVWSDVSLVTDLNAEEDWELDAKPLTDGYLLSLVTPLEIGMTAAPFTFAQPKDLTQEQLWLLYLLLTPESEKEATYQKADKLYHITQDDMNRTLSQYVKGYKLDLAKDAKYDEKTGEIVTPMVSGFGGDRLAKLREKTVNGNTVTFTVDYYGADDVNFKTAEASKTYTITFRYGGYFYDSALEASV